MAFTVEEINGLKVLTTDNDGVAVANPSGAGGDMIQDNFVRLGNRGIRDADRVVVIDGANAVAYRGHAQISSSSTHATAIQAAIDDLTAARTSKESVLLVGDFTLTAALSIPAYTILEVRGTITLDVDSDVNMLVNSDQVGPTTEKDIEIIGGTWDADEANHVTSGNVAATFELINVENLIIRGVTMIDSIWDHIHLGDASWPTLNVSISDCIFDGSRDDGINPLNCSDVRIANSHARNCTNDGFHISTDSTNVVLSNCTSENNGDTGFTSRTDGLTFTNCLARNNTNRGFNVVAGLGNTLTNCVSKDNTDSGYRVEGTSDVTLTGCLSDGNGQQGFEIASTISRVTFVNCISTGDALQGFFLAGDEVIVSGCLVFNSGDSGIEGSALCENVIISGCLVQGATGAGIEVSGPANSQCVITGCIILSPTQYGIFLSNKLRAIIGDCYIDGPTTNFDGINLNVCDQTLISNCHVINAIRRGIDIGPLCDDTRINNCKFDGTVNVQDDGVRTTFNGTGDNGTNDPASAGDWNGVIEEGLTIHWDDAGTDKLVTMIGGTLYTATVT